MSEHKEHENFLTMHFNKRAVAAGFFITGNLTAALAPSQQMEGVQYLVLAFFMASSFAYPLSNRYPRALIGAGATSLAAQSILAWVASGQGGPAQIAGLIPSMLKSIMTIKAGFNEAGSAPYQYRDVRASSFSKMVNLFNRYPIVSGALIEFPGLVTLGLGAALSHEWGLMAGVVQWVAGNFFLAWSDPQLEKILNPAPK